MLRSMVRLSMVGRSSIRERMGSSDLDSLSEWALQSVIALASKVHCFGKVKEIFADYCLGALNMSS